MKKGFLFKKCVLAIGLFSSIATLSSCSAFFGGDEYTITDTSVETDENGNTVVTVNFSGEDVAPLTFTIPATTKGISSVTSEVQDNQVTLTINFNDGTNQQIGVPIINGKDGVSISEVELIEHEDGTKGIQFHYSNGEVSDEFPLPSGKDGLGIASIEETDENGQHKITITFNDETKEPLEFYVNDGVSIESVEYSEEYSNEDEYALVITFSDGSSSIQFLPRPTTNKWHSGLVDPSNSIGKNGDFYLNEANGNVFSKKNDTWVYLFSMKGDVSEEITQYYNVIFNFRDDEYTEDLTPGSKLLIKAKKGESIPLDQIPLPSRDGFTFAGWFAGEEVNPNVGQFTNLTTVSSNLDLFARWQSM